MPAGHVDPVFIIIRLNPFLVFSVFVITIMPLILTILNCIFSSREFSNSTLKGLFLCKGLGYNLTDDGKDFSLDLSFHHNPVVTNKFIFPLFFFFKEK